MRSRAFTLPSDEAVNAYKIIDQRYSHIGSWIQMFWGSQEFTNLTHRLLHEDDNPVQFDPQVQVALVTLQRAHDSRFPQFAAHNK